ncbi:MAG: ABC transporter permease [Anaerolineae bacterium]|nr:ABC transporter permease [Anaerolineae bacterium]
MTGEERDLLVILASILAQGLRFATPYLYASLGEMFGQLSGMLNLGVDGIMLMGAFTGFIVAYQTPEGADVTAYLWLGVLAAALVGALLGLATAVVNVTLGAEQGISGIGFYMFGFGLSSLLIKVTVGRPTPVAFFPDIRFPVLSDLPLVGDALFSHNIMTYGAYLLVPVSWWVINRTTLGLKIRAVGQNPEAADSLGVSVARIRYLTATLGGTLAGVAGASLSIALYHVIQENITNGIGFIAVALVYFGAWTPAGVLIGSALFGVVSAVSRWVQALGLGIDPNVAVMLPYIVTIVVLVFSVQRARQPAALTKPFQRGEG